MVLFLDSKLYNGHFINDQTRGSTTEHVMAVKILTEMATTTPNYTFHLLMLDMSKAFDTVDRKTLFEILSEILDQDELHVMKVLTEDVKLKVKIEDEIGKEITTDTVPQGDCMSNITTPNRDKTSSLKKKTQQ